MTDYQSPSWPHPLIPPRHLLSSPRARGGCLPLSHPSTLPRPNPLTLPPPGCPATSSPVHGPRKVASCRAAGRGGAGAPLREARAGCVQVGGEREGGGCRGAGWLCPWRGKGEQGGGGQVCGKGGGASRGGACGGRARGERVSWGGGCRWVGGEAGFSGGRVLVGQPDLPYEPPSPLLLRACCRACRLGDYHAFAQLYRTAPRMTPYLMDRLMPRMRAWAMQVGSVCGNVDRTGGRGSRGQDPAPSNMAGATACNVGVGDTGG